MPNETFSPTPETRPAAPADVLRGKRILCLGSSVTYGFAADGWSFADALAERYGCAIVKEAVNGTTLADRDDASYVARLKRVADAGPFDLLLCQLSTNDAWQGVPLGDADSADPRDVTGAIRAVARIAREKWGAGLPVAFYTGARFEGDAYDAMVRRLNAMAPGEGIDVIDLWNDRAFNAIPGDHYGEWMEDPVHPRRDGYALWWAPRIARGLAALFEGMKP